MAIVEFATSAVSRDGCVWRARIFFDDPEAPEGVGASLHLLDVDGIVIEWKETPLHESMWGSSCTLTFNNRGFDNIADFRDLPFGAVTVKIFQGEYLYWQGVIDMESYSEPFDRADNYDITLTAIDLGALKRFKFNKPKRERITILSMLTEGFAAAGLDIGFNYDTQLFHPAYTTGMPLGLNGFSVFGDNFYDEDGEPMTWYDAIEAVLQPLNLRLIQCSSGWGDSSFYVVSNSEAPFIAPRPISWAGTGQTRSVSRAYGTVEVTFSPYGTAQALDQKAKVDDIKFAANAQSHGYGLDVLYESDKSQPLGFDLTWGWATKGYMVNLGQVYNRACHGLIKKKWSGSDCAFIMASRYIYRKANNNPGPQNPNNNDGIRMLTGNDRMYAVDDVKKYEKLFECDPVHFSYKPERLCITLEMLFDSRYNPFEDAILDNEKGSFEEQQRIDFVAVPAIVSFYGDNGGTYYLCNTPYHGVFGNHYDNCWVPSTSEIVCWFAFYGEPGHGKLLNGWIQNNQFLGYYDAASSDRRIWSRRGKGEYIGGPPVAGTMTITILDGIYAQKGRVSSSSGKVTSAGLPADKDTLSRHLDNLGYPIFDRFRWLCYKSVTVDILDRDSIQIEADDVVYTAELSPNRSEKQSVNLRCGSATDVSPSAKGTMYLDGKPIERLVHHGLTASPEEILLASMARQYRVPGIALDGEIEATADGVPLFAMRTPRSDAALPGHIFAITSAVQHCLLNTVDVAMTEIWPFDYKLANLIVKE